MAILSFIKVDIMMSEFNNGLNQMIVAIANRFERIAKYPDDAGSARIGVMTLQDARDLLYLAKRRIENLATENMALDADRLAFAKLYGDKTGDPEVVELANTFIPSATNAFLDEIKTQARLEGINFAAGRLAAAFNHGFVDKPVAEVSDVVRMILGAKEDITSNPTEDGLSGEYAEQSLKDWEQQLSAAQAQPESEIPFGNTEPMEVTDDMVFEFHNSISDEPITDDKFRDIKYGLSAVLMNNGTLTNEGTIKIDGWIKCDEHMPKKSGAYWCWFGNEKPSVIQQRVCMFNALHNEWCDSSVTHWMPLPVAPTPEGEPSRDKS
ncbi:DUF551 domain-containing protein [Yersinia enterocolitica]